MKTDEPFDKCCLLWVCDLSLLQVVGLLRRIMESETDTDVFYRCLVALGTLIVNLPQPQQRVSLITKCKEYDVPAVLPPLNENVSTDGKVGDASQDLLLLLE